MAQKQGIDLKIYSFKSCASLYILHPFYQSLFDNTTIKKTLDKKTISFIVPEHVATLFAYVSEISGRIRGKASVLSRERLKEFKAINWSVDCTEIVKLGYSPEFSLEEGLKHTIGWYKKHGWIKENNFL